MYDVGLVYIGIFLALAFDFGNGLNDAANAISTVVATKVLTIRQAVLLSAFCNFIAAFVFSTAVAKTIGKGLVVLESITVLVVICAVLSAIFWVYMSSWRGMPISASHSLIGGLIGAAVAANGVGVLLWSGIIKVLIFIIVAPVLGFIVAILFSLLVYNLVKTMAPASVNKWSKRLQLISVSVYSLGHGANDAQKTMGIITLLLFSGGFISGEFDVPLWVIIVSHGTIALGTLVGGAKVIRTMGMKITKLKPIHGFCAETSGAGVIIWSTMMGIPVSTTHVIAGSIGGVGSTRRTSAVRWGMARKLVYAWIITIPLTAIVGGVSYLLISAF
ncbi:MAG: inorganic phosphate transporter [Candidatus Micrarchaeota archaeon]